jgi:hypothetical protein
VPSQPQAWRFANEKQAGLDEVRPVLRDFEAEAWNARNIPLAEPIVGTCRTVDTGLPRIRGSRAAE